MLPIQELAAKLMVTRYFIAKLQTSKAITSENSDVMLFVREKMDDSRQWLFDSRDDAEEFLESLLLKDPYGHFQILELISGK